MYLLGVEQKDRLQQARELFLFIAISRAFARYTTGSEPVKPPKELYLSKPLKEVSEKGKVSIEVCARFFFVCFEA